MGGRKCDSGLPDGAGSGFPGSVKGVTGRKGREGGSIVSRSGVAIDGVSGSFSGEGWTGSQMGVVRVFPGWVPESGLGVFTPLRV